MFKKCLELQHIHFITKLVIFAKYVTYFYKCQLKLQYNFRHIAVKSSTKIPLKFTKLKSHSFLGHKVDKAYISIYNWVLLHQSNLCNHFSGNTPLDDRVTDVWEISKGISAIGPSSLNLNYEIKVSEVFDEMWYKFFLDSYSLFFIFGMDGIMATKTLKMVQKCFASLL